MVFQKKFQGKSRYTINHKFKLANSCFTIWSECEHERSKNIIESLLIYEYRNSLDPLCLFIDLFFLANAMCHWMKNNKGYTLEMLLLEAYEKSMLIKHGSLIKKDKIDTLMLNKYFIICETTVDKIFLKHFTDCFNIDHEQKISFLMKLRYEKNFESTAVLAEVFTLQTYFTVDNLVIPLVKSGEFKIAWEFLDSSYSHNHRYLRVLDNNIIRTAEEERNLKDCKFVLPFTMLKLMDLRVDLYPSIWKILVPERIDNIFTDFSNRKLNINQLHASLQDLLSIFPGFYPKVAQSFVSGNMNVYATAYSNFYNKISPNSSPSINFLFKRAPEFDVSKPTDVEVGGGHFSPGYKSALVVHNSSTFKIMLKRLSTATHIAIDTKLKQNISLRYMYNISILTFASNVKIFVLDMIKLTPSLRPNDWKQLIKLFTSKGIRKISFSFQSYSDLLEDIIPDFNSLDIENIIDLSRCEFERLMKNIRNPNSEDGVLNIINCQSIIHLYNEIFNLELPDLDQELKWFERPLNVVNVEYAAKTVNCILEISAFFNHISDQHELGDWTESCHVTKVRKALMPYYIKMLGAEKPDQHSESIKHQLRFFGPENMYPISHKTISFICDYTFRALGYQLRLCGLSVLINLTHTLNCVSIFQREFGIVITSHKGYDILKDYIPKAYLCVPDKEDQLLDSVLKMVIEKYEIQVTEQFLLTRCPRCNSMDILVFVMELLKQNNVFSKTANNDYQTNGSILRCDNGYIDLATHKTHNDAHIDFGRIRYRNQLKCKYLFICSACGRPLTVLDLDVIKASNCYYFNIYNTDCFHQSVKFGLTRECAELEITNYLIAQSRKNKFNLMNINEYEYLIPYENALIDTIQFSFNDFNVFYELDWDEFMDKNNIIKSEKLASLLEVMS